MAITIFISILFVGMKTEILTQGQRVPCLFFFGDSLFDNGNTKSSKQIIHLMGLIILVVFQLADILMDEILLIFSVLLLDLLNSN